MKIVVGLSSYAFQKFLDRYGEEILAYSTRRGEQLLREYGPGTVRWTADRGNDIYEAVAPRAAGAVSRFSAITRRPAKGAVIPGADDPESSRLATVLFGPFAGDLGRIGAYLRAAVVLGAEQLRNLSDEQIGAIAVAFWHAQNRDSILGRRIRGLLWRRSDTGE